MARLSFGVMLGAFLFQCVVGCSAKPMRQGQFVCEDGDSCPSGWFCGSDGYCYSTKDTVSETGGDDTATTDTNIQDSDTVTVDESSDGSDDTETETLTDTVEDSETDSCLAQSYRQCASDGNVRWYDSCDGEGSVADECPETNGTCVNQTSTTAECRCTGNWDMATGCTSCKGLWTGSSCAACPPNADESSGCATCLAGWVGNSCEICVRYVDVDASPTSPTGTSWDRAYPKVSRAINKASQAVAADNDLSSCEVWVAEGVYYIGVDDSFETVQLLPFVEVYGGFSGGEVRREERDHSNHLTVLSGCDSANCFDRVEHVVTGANDARLSGFIVTGGSAKGAHGGGMFNSGVSPVVENCVFVHNEADSRGGAVYNENASPRFEDCIFAGNASSGGAAVYNQDSGSPEFAHCVFTANNGSEGAALFSVNGIDVTVKESFFVGNSASGSGGAIYGKTDCSHSVRNAVLVGNTGKEGGAVYLESGGSHFFTNATFVDNAATVENTGLIHFKGNETRVHVTNTILWNVDLDELFYESGTLTVYYSDVEGGHGGIGEVTGNPGFAGDVLHSDNWSSVAYDSEKYLTALRDTSANWTAGGLGGLIVRPDTASKTGLWIQGNSADTVYVWGDMRSLASAGRFYAIYDFHLGKGSPCIDVGDGDSAPERDLDGNDRYDDPETTAVGSGSPNYTDIGAFEYRP